MHNMMKDIKRKVSFFYLFLKEGNREIPIENELIRLTRYISSLPKKIKNKILIKIVFVF